MQWALYMASKGFRVFPLAENGNKPLGEGWPDLASSDPVTIRSWYETGYEIRQKGQEPRLRVITENNNYAVLTTDMIVLDVDMKKGRDGLTTFRSYAPNEDTLTVRTPSGGFHFYYNSFGISYANSQGDQKRSGLGEGLDLRSYHGFVVGPGSVRDGIAYSLERDVEPAVFPNAISDKLRFPGEKHVDHDKDIGDRIDHPVSIAAAVSWTKEQPGAKAGDLSLAAYTMGCKMSDFGLSEEMALDVLLTHWNDRNEPPLELEDLEGRIANGFLHGQNAPGCCSPAFALTGVSMIPLPEMEQRPDGDPDAAPPSAQDDWRFGNLTPLTEIQPRPWVVKDMLMRREVTSLIAAGAAGKTTCMLGMAVLLAAGYADIFGYENRHAGQPLTSAIHSAEDSLEELSRRIHAFCHEFGIDAAEIAPHIALSSGKTRSLRLAQAVDFGPPQLVEESVAAITKICNQRPIDVVMFDPLVNLHDLQENNNAHMAFLVQTFAALGEATNAAIVVAHHTAKPSGNAAYTIHDSRGAGAIINSSRVALVLQGMNDLDRETYHYTPDEAAGVSYLTDGKSNMVAKNNKRHWFKMKSVVLWTGDAVGVPVPFNMNSRKSANEEQIARKLAHMILDQADGGASIGLKMAAAALRSQDAFFARMSEKAVEDRLRTILREPIHLTGESDPRYNATVSIASDSKTTIIKAI